MRTTRPIAALVAFGVIALGGCGAQRNGSNVSRDPLASFRVLRGMAEPLPERLRSILQGARDPEIKALQMGRAHPLKIHGERFWALRGSGVVCLVQGRGGLSCANNATFTHKGLILALFTPQGKTRTRTRYSFSVWGIAPDWARVASLRVGRVTRGVRVHDNAYAYRAARPIFLKRLHA